MFLAVQSNQIIRTFVIHQNNKTMNDSTEITQELLLRNGWTLYKNNDIFQFNGIILFCIDKFACGILSINQDLIGKAFTTIGELKAIAKALYKVELTFK